MLADRPTSATAPAATAAHGVELLPSSAWLAAAPACCCCCVRGAALALSCTGWGRSWGWVRAGGEARRAERAACAGWPAACPAPPATFSPSCRPVPVPARIVVAALLRARSPGAAARRGTRWCPWCRTNPRAPQPAARRRSSHELVGFPGLVPPSTQGRSDTAGRVSAGGSRQERRGSTALLGGRRHLHADRPCFPFTCCRPQRAADALPPAAHVVQPPPTSFFRLATCC